MFCWPDSTAAIAASRAQARPRVTHPMALPHMLRHMVCPGTLLAVTGGCFSGSQPYTKVSYPSSQPHHAKEYRIQWINICFGPGGNTHVPSLQGVSLTLSPETLWICCIMLQCSGVESGDPFGGAFGFPFQHTPKPLPPPFCERVCLSLAADSLQAVVSSPRY